MGVRRRPVSGEAVAGEREGAGVAGGAGGEG